MAAGHGAILGWAAYMHIAGRQRRVGFLRALRRFIKPGGPLLLSFFVYEDSRARRLTSGLAGAIRAMRRAEPLERGDSFTGTFDHRFTREEIRQELTASGFELAFYSEHLYGHAVARAIGPTVTMPPRESQGMPS